jgi:hypothetical protein
MRELNANYWRPQEELFPDGLAEKTFLDIGCGSGLQRFRSVRRPFLPCTSMKIPSAPRENC